MEARFDGSNWNIQNLSNFAVFEILKVGKHESLFQCVWETINALADPISSLRLFKVRNWTR